MSEDGTPDAEFLIVTDEGYATTGDPGLVTCAFTNTHGLATGGQPTLTCLLNFLPVIYTEPNNASQPGKPQSLYPGYGAKQVLYKNGAIDFAMTTTVSSSQDGILWAEVQPQLSALDPANPQNQTVQNTIMRQAGVLAVTNSNGPDIFMPTYYPSSEDDGVLVYTYSSATYYPAIAITGRRATDAPGIMTAGMILAPGSNGTDGHWGTYAGCSLDTNLTSRGLIWCGSEYVGSDTWDTWIEGLRVE